ncbi:MAG: GNAT family N-acetyltransferase [Spirochaetales bacterium]|nr:GNAT family N-acetyltransferase [Spirochaetales bacterium]
MDSPGTEEIRLLPAGEGEIPLLVDISTRTFLEHSERMSPHPAGGPAGYNSIDWHKKALENGLLYKICRGTSILGGLYMTELPDSCGWVNRVFLDTSCQKQGIGRRVFALLERLHPDIGIWGLDTPEWAVDNLGFYHSLGYRVIELRRVDEEEFNLVILEKRAPGADYAED